MELTGGDASGGGQRTLPARMDEALPGADVHRVERPAEEGADSSHPLQWASVLVGLEQKGHNVGPAYRRRHMKARTQYNTTQQRSLCTRTVCMYPLSMYVFGLADALPPPPQGRAFIEPRRLNGGAAAQKQSREAGSTISVLQAFFCLPS